ncbi:hypothetical protein [Pseudoalteromonas sp. Of7M-16]|uniref:hypothetical protein n=1 Tax=Pseudoalteromonas sp. Of7M-16 TaxID=2917756 RepID=UPI001EF68A36|nr:hypothetical protein [Pseudoalteromonas sp. Of7M-16]MCG7548561.1 hypothetical protein [Pseudoalteromonas sp. Of7M-16]
MQRELTEHELINKPSWATHYYITEYDNAVFESVDYFQHGLNGKRFKSRGYVTDGALRIDSEPEPKLSNIFFTAFLSTALATLLAVVIITWDQFGSNDQLASAGFIAALIYSIKRLYNSQFINKGLNNEN